MKKTTIRKQMQPGLIADNSKIKGVVGLDLGEKKSWLVRLNLKGEEVANRSISTTRAALRKCFKCKSRLRVVIEAGSHSNWIAALLKELGHEFSVANPRQLKLVSESLSKNDRRDARLLDELGLTSPKLLSPTQPLSQETLRNRCVLIGRQALVRARTKLINSLRGMLKNFGIRVSAGDASTFAKRARLELSEEFQALLEGLLMMIEQLSEQIKQADARVKQLCETRYPATELIEQIRGVGATTSLAFALALDNDAGRLDKSRAAGAFVGLRPKQRDSGSCSPELHISKVGDGNLRCLLVQCAQYILGRHGQDSALRRWGLGLAEHGGKNAKKRAIVAVARKLAVLMHVLWSRGAVYEPFPQGVNGAKTMATIG